VYKVGVIDYQAGNIENVIRALRLLKKDVHVITKPSDFSNCSHFILPGVGAFPFGMTNLEYQGLVGPIRKVIQEGKPFLGICLGMQLLFEKSEEFEITLGLGVVSGSVKSLKKEVDDVKLKIPRIGWFRVEKHTNLDPNRFPSVIENEYFYFAHSFHAIPTVENAHLVTKFGSQILCAGVWIDNLVGVQFHPEKSAQTGITFLKHFLDL
jgi:glutamine amidotransferase